uniref:hypothetical protein n=1 Tax=Mycoplasmopsis bovis TaxID=28903 RepID=UPI003D296E4A
AITTVDKIIAILTLLDIFTDLADNFEIAFILSTVVIAILAIAISVYFVIKKQKRKLNLKNEI